MYEVRLSRRGVVAGGSALALSAVFFYLSGLLIGLGWSPTAPPPSPAEPASEAAIPEGTVVADSRPLDAVPLEQAGEGSAATSVIPGELGEAVDPARATGLEVEPPIAARAPNRVRLVALEPLPAARVARYRRFEHRDPWFRFSEPVPLTPFGELIYRVSRRHRMSPRLVAAVVWAESAFDPAAVSAKGARGLMQVMPATARRFGIGADRLFDPETNLDVGVRYLRFLSERYAGDMLMILAAYNAGEGAVDDYRDVPPFPETRDFIHRVAALLEPSALGRDRLD